MCLKPVAFEHTEDTWKVSAALGRTNNTKVAICTAFLLFIVRLFDIAVLEMFPLTILDYKKNEHMPFASDGRSTEDGRSVADVLDAARMNLIVVARIAEPGRV